MQKTKFVIPRQVLHTFSGSVPNYVSHEKEVVMAQGGKEVLQGMAFLAAIAAAVVCGVGLFFMGVDGNLSQTHFIRLGLSTLGAAMVAAVAGVFLVGAMEANEKKKDEAATSAAKHEPEAAESRST